MSEGLDLFLTDLAQYPATYDVVLCLGAVDIETIPAREYMLPAGDLQGRLAGDPGGGSMPEPCTKKVKVATNLLNVRAQPTTKATILTQLPNGTEVEIVLRAPNPSADGHEWLQRYNAPYGWVARDLTSDRP